MTVAVDTSPFIFFIEQHPRYISCLRPFFKAVDSGDCQIVTSTVTLLEVLVHPIRHGDESLAQSYNDILLSSKNIRTISVSPHTAQVAAELRAVHKLKTPDAIQVATAMTNGAEVIFTSDNDFKSLTKLRVLSLHDLIR